MRLIECSAWEGSGEFRAELAGKALLTRRVPSLKPCSNLPFPQRLLWNEGGVSPPGRGTWEKMVQQSAPPQESPSRQRRLSWQPSALTVLGRGSMGLSFPSCPKENWNRSWCFCRSRLVLQPLWRPPCLEERLILLLNVEGSNSTRQGPHTRI